MAISLHYIEMGDGFPLFLLHGNGEDGGYFSGQLRPFAEKHKVIAIDTRGHGNSPRGGAPFRLEQFADDLYRFMRKKGIERADILGFSDGANIAMIFAMTHPNRVRKLILNGGNIEPNGVKLSVLMKIKAELAYYSFLSAFSKRYKSHVEMLRLMTDEPHISPRELSKIKAPTLVLAGKDDLIKNSHTRLIASKIQNSKLVFIDGNHFIAQTNTKEYNRVVLEFLA